MQISDENPPEGLPAVTATAGTPGTASDTGEKRRNYNRLVRQAKLLSILLEKIEFKISPESVGVNKALVNRGLGAKATVLAAGITDGTCVASIEWSLSVKFRKKVITRCSATYLVTYEGMKNCTEESVRIFVDNVAKTATYAYFRALYAHLDWSANLGSPPLPIVQFQPKV